MGDDKKEKGVRDLRENEKQKLKDTGRKEGREEMPKEREKGDVWRGAGKGEMRGRKLRGKERI